MELDRYNELCLIKNEGDNYSIFIAHYTIKIFVNLKNITLLNIIIKLLIHEML